MESRVCYVPGIVWLSSEKRECGQKSSAEKKGMGSERKGTPDKAGMSKAVTRQPEREKAGPCRCLDGMAGRRVREGIIFI